MEMPRRTSPRPAPGLAVVPALLALVASMLTGLVVAAPAAEAAPVVGSTPAVSWRVDGRVYATQVIGNTVVVGGSFTTATSPTGESVARRNLAAFRLDTGELVRSWRADAGSTVRAIDHDGTWLYVGGAFARIGGALTGTVGRVRISDAQVDPGFGVQTDRPVRALDVRDGVVWVGGAFTTVNGEPRERIAKVDATTAALDPTFRPTVNNDVWGIVKNPTSDTVYVSGNFGLAGGVARAGVAALNGTTGAVRPTVFTSSSRPTLGLDINDAGTRLFGAGGSGANTMAAWSTTTGARVWRHVVMGDVQGVTHHRGQVYFGFHDGYDDDTTIKVLAADEATGVLDPAFRPRFNAFWGVFAIAASDAGVVVGGEFTAVSGVPAQGWARFMATGVTTPPPPPTTSLTAFVTAETPWRYWDGPGLANGWQQPAHDDSAWVTGAGHFGYGDGDETVVLRSSAGGTRSITSYFRTTFEVAQTPTEDLTLELVADDGAVVHLNGVEVVRDNMPPGPVSASTRAASNRSGAAENVARNFTVPAKAVRTGTNTLAVEVHQDSSSSSDLSFAAALLGTVPLAAPVNQAPVARATAQVDGRTVTLDATASSDDAGITGYEWELGDGATATGGLVTHTYAAGGSYPVTLRVRDAAGAVGTTTLQVDVAETVTTTLVGLGASWKWYHQLRAPGAGWAARGFDDSAWATGGALLGWGAPEVVTDVNPFATAAERPVTSYYRRAVTVTDLASVVGLRLTAIANDGAVVHVNGVEVGRQNMRDGAVTHTTYAPTARRHAVAAANPLVVDVPAALLVEGTNVIAVETHVNYRNTPDVTFGAQLDLVRR
ncbi:PKD domain-containing protein [Nocardioides sp. Y6]|uniref:PKD domain-containing protein n=1 Tax=Nocardioides malaquae TaxID=2773426 RepID=A0ABR9RRF6_9ACTN|nr:PKD domain-containing protein [Nocardioides malaquae]MBE7323975.1 PKD domain-containing protein [Nocardioides malaquae]